MKRDTGKRRSARISSRRSWRVDIWLLRHLQVALSSLGRFAHSPLSSLMTSAVVGIALALPAGLHLLLNNLQALSGNWDGAATISLYLEQRLEPTGIEQLVGHLQLDPAVGDLELISSDQALAEFRRLSGFSGALDTLDENPLPAVVVVEPTVEQSSPEAAAALLERLEALDGVDFAQLDLQWVRRFQAITDTARRAVLVLASLLGMAVLLIVVNTIRLEIQARQAEIEISKLIGATNAFIRRPFLYSGFWYGLFGGLIAWLLVTLSLWLLDAPVARLAGLYQSSFELAGIDLLNLLLLLTGGALLGLLGSWVAVGRHLHQIEPS